MITQIMKRLLRGCGIVAVRTHNIALPYLENPPRSLFDAVLLRQFVRLDGLSFVQIGANDGRRYDPIHGYVARNGWTGVMLEPVPSSFKQLELRHAGNKRLTLVQAAVDTHDGRRPIFHLHNKYAATAPEWALGVASFDRRLVQDHLRELALGEDAVAETSVPTITWSKVWALRPAPSCDVLVIDAEGYDIPLLRMADLTRHRPRVVHFEHAHASIDEWMSYLRELNCMGYDFATETGDTTAWLR